MESHKALEVLIQLVNHYKAKKYFTVKSKSDFSILISLTLQLFIQYQTIHDTAQSEQEIYPLFVVE